MTDPKEPGPWELMRGIERIERGMQAFVTQAVYNSLERRVDDLQKDNDALRKTQEEQGKVKAQQWFSIGLAVLVGVISIVVGIVGRQVGVTP